MALLLVRVMRRQIWVVLLWVVLRWRLLLFIPQLC
jgi:hypothetical protein